MGAIKSLLHVGERSLVLVEIGLLQIVVDRIQRRAGLDLVALANTELDHAPGFVGADEDHVGFDPALIAAIPALTAARQHRNQHQRSRKSPYPSRRGHAALRSPNIKSIWTLSIASASSATCLPNSPCQIIATKTGATTICGKRTSARWWISPRAMPYSISFR